MAWISLDLDDTLVRTEVDPVTGEEAEVPVEGAVEAVSNLFNDGHRLTVFTARLQALPDSEKYKTKRLIEEKLESMGFPTMEVWIAGYKPAADIFIDNKAVTFDGDWSLALAQTNMMLSEAGLLDNMTEVTNEDTDPTEGA